MEKNAAIREHAGGAGILMPVSSLPFPYGIGTLGKAAYKTVPFFSQHKLTVKRDGV